MKKNIADYYQLIERLAEGAQGEVWLTIKIDGGQYFATKKLRKIPQRRIIESQNKEMEILRDFRENNHINVIKLEEIFEDQQYYYLVLEYCQENIKSYIEKNYKEGVPEKLAIIMLNQILQGMYALHQRGYTHRDLKPANILIDNQQTVKIADFGVSKDKDSMKTETGTDKYMAPEIFDRSITQTKLKYDYKVDIWAIGIICFELLFNQLPFKAFLGTKILSLIKNYTEGKQFDAVKIFQDRQDQINLQKALNLSVNMKDLLSRLLTFLPDQRCSYEELFNHVIFSEQKEYNDQDLRKKASEFYSKSKIFQIQQNDEEQKNQNQEDLSVIQETLSNESNSTQNTQIFQFDQNETQNSIQLKFQIQKRPSITDFYKTEPLFKEYLDRYSFEYQRFKFLKNFIEELQQFNLCYFEFKNCLIYYLVKAHLFFLNQLLLYLNNKNMELQEENKMYFNISLKNQEEFFKSQGCKFFINLIEEDIEESDYLLYELYQKAHLECKQTTESRA